MARKPEPQVIASCSRCGRPMMVDAWLVSVAMAWNEKNRRRDEITEHDVALCDRCQEELATPPHEQQSLFRKDN